MYKILIVCRLLLTRFQELLTLEDVNFFTKIIIYNSKTDPSDKYILKNGLVEDSVTRNA
jgi:hypothetical protein